MGVNCAVVTEVRKTNIKYPRCMLGFKVISSKAMSHSQGWVPYYGTMNLLTFQLVAEYV
jgi:hypothetical protein